MPHHGSAAQSRPRGIGVAFAPNDQVDFVIVGSGAAGAVVARELSKGGFRVVVLEQGPYLREGDFKHDEFGVDRLSALTNHYPLQPNTLRWTEQDTAKTRPAVRYGRCVGGGTVHFTGNLWRFHEIDFVEKTRVGAPDGSALADWPITYADLEPYYTKVEWEIGVSGQAGVNPFDPPRRKGYPLPPHPPKPIGVLLDRAASKLGYHSVPAPMAILSRPYRGRAACIQCGLCEMYGCEVRAKSSTLATMIPEAEATGRCEIRPNCYVRKVELDSHGRAIGVRYFDIKRKEVLQRARAVVLCANGAETPRLLLMSKSNAFPDGLANSSGLVGKHLMFNGGALAAGTFEHEVNGYRGLVVTRIVQDFYELHPSLGLSGGGGMDFRFDLGPIAFATFGLGMDAPRWGPEYKRLLRESYTRTVLAMAHATSLPVATNSVSLDPTLADDWGLPAIRVTWSDHPNDMKLNDYLKGRIVEILHAADAKRVWAFPNDPDLLFPQPHLLGTCRMGSDPATSVVDRYHRAHDVPNLFMVDGSSFVTSGRGQPTMTILALAFRAAHYMKRMASRGELGAGARKATG